MFRTLLLSQTRRFAPRLLNNRLQRIGRRMTSGGKSGHLNRLAVAKSPYLRQHATNPVDWYPFEKTALDKAKAENKVCRPSPRLTRGDIPVNWIQCLSLVSCSPPSLKKCNVQVM